MQAGLIQQRTRCLRAMTDALKHAAVIKGSSDGLCQESLRNTEGEHLLTPFLAPAPRGPTAGSYLEKKGEK